MNKRLLKELRNLYIQQNQRDILQNDYLIYFDDNNINRVSALIKAPYDSVYRHKFVRLNMNIPDNYPHSPPEVSFVNHDDVRIHPNMYENGKCCSTILNTWGDNKYEKWTSSMGIETILLTFHSFLDNNPYTYEPGGRDDPNYTVYVLYQSWITCLIRYLQHETIPLFKQMIHNYMLGNINEIFDELYKLEELYPYGEYNTRCFEIDDYIINYDRILQTLQNHYQYIDYIENIMDESEELIDYAQFINREYACSICFDTEVNSKSTYCILSCGHKFHKECVKSHITNNSTVCPMCRRELSNEDIKSCEEVFGDQCEEVSGDQWVINPSTKRRVKVGSRTWKYLVEEGVL